MIILKLPGQQIGIMAGVFHLDVMLSKGTFFLFFILIISDRQRKLSAKFVYTINCSFIVLMYYTYFYYAYSFPTLIYFTYLYYISNIYFLRSYRPRNLNFCIDTISMTMRKKYFFLLYFFFFFLPLLFFSFLQGENKLHDTVPYNFSQHYD